MNDMHGSPWAGYPGFSDFYRSHPEFRLRDQDRLGWGGNGLNYEHRAVCDYMLAYCHELVERYDFEKYINRKPTGAYYTKEDITGYICRNTIIPGLLDKVRERCGGAFDGAAWPLLQQEPDRYIWPAMQHGRARMQNEFNGI